jgi:hypothetical protein
MIDPIKSAAHKSPLLGEMLKRRFKQSTKNPSIPSTGTLVPRDVSRYREPTQQGKLRNLFPKFPKA